VTGEAAVDAIALALLAAAFTSVAARGFFASLWLLVAQAILLAAVAATIAAGSGAQHMWVAVALTVTVRVVAVPVLLFRIMRTIGSRRELRPLVSTRTALLLSLGLTLVAYGTTGHLDLSGAFPSRNALPVSLALTLIGLLLMVTRRKAVSQVIGLITIENGIFLAGIIATLGLPLLVEIGVFFDLLVGVAVMAAFTLRINTRFDTVDTDRLRSLRG